MKKNKTPVRFTGQHFTIDKVLIADAIEAAGIKEDDTVLDIGAGKGFITVHLACKCKRILAIENDKFLLEVLRKKFSQESKIKIVDADFTHYTIPNERFKAVSNIPYGITSGILKSLMFNHAEHFLGGSLVMQLEAARKLVAKAVFNPYTVFYQTFFNLAIMYEVGPESFMPPPKVKSALVKIEAKKNPKMDITLKERYLNFLFFCLGFPELPVRTVLKKIFRKSQVREITEKYGIDPCNLVIHLSAMQWSGCFLEMLEKVPERYQQ